MPIQSRIAVWPLILFVTLTGLAQTGTRDQGAAEDLLRRAAENARRYTDTMRNLAAEETRDTEIYRNGKLDKRRRIVSDLVVHQAGSGSSGTLSEFRNVREVDGKAVRDREDRLSKLSRSLSNANSIGRELEVINRESSRYDLEAMRMQGMTLNQAWPLESENLWHALEFHAEGMERVADRETTIIAFKQIRDIPDLRPAGNLFDVLKLSRAFYRGRVWIEPQTGQIWRYEVEIMAEDRSQPEPLVLDRTEYYYAPGSFEIPTPRRIVWTSFTEWSRVRNQLKLSVSGRVSADYGPFKRFGAEVQINPVR